MSLYLKLLFLVLILLCAAFGALSDVFISVPNFLNILLATSTIGLLAIGASFVIGAAGLDLSVGSLMALTSVAAMILVNAWDFPWPFILLLSLGSGAAIGAFNGALISGLSIPAFIVTLGMLSVARGMALILSDGLPIYGLPPEVLYLGQGKAWGIPVPVFVFLIVGAIAHIFLRHTTFGRYSLAIGDNKKAARNAGVRIRRYTIYLYAFSGLLAALAGLLFMTRINAADPSSGVMYELTGITAAIIGGTSLFGGRASVVGAMLGALIMGVLQNGLTLLNVPAYFQQVIIGSMLILAVALGQWKGKSHGIA